MSLIQHFDRIRSNFRGRLIAPYQDAGVRWMLHREMEEPKGGICSDEMGLGKTIEMLATMIGNPQNNATLIIVPKSLIMQWVDACIQFTGVHPLVLLSNSKKKMYANATSDLFNRRRIVIIPYSFLTSSLRHIVLQYHWGRIVLDEAHAIKNRRSKTHKHVFALSSSIKWALTGTPITRSKKDFHALLAWIGVDREQISDKLATTTLREKYVLRRTITDVALQCERLRLVPCDIQTVHIQFSDPERIAYDDLFNEGRSLVESSSLSATAHSELVEVITRLRQACIDPEMVWSGRGVQKVWPHIPSKLLALKRLIREHPDNTKTIIFTHWNHEARGIYRMVTEELGLKAAILHGGLSITARDHVIHDFVHSPGDHILISHIDIGGIGLNLQVATRVYIYSPAWNASAELQAISRAWRQGQTQKVHVRRLVISDSIEEYILRVQQLKLDCAAHVLGDQRIKRALQLNLTFDDMKHLFHM